MSLVGNIGSKFFWIYLPGGRSDYFPDSTPGFSDISDKIESLDGGRELIYGKNVKNGELMVKDWSITSWWVSTPGTTSRILERLKMEQWFVQQNCLG